MKSLKLHTQPMKSLKLSTKKTESGRVEHLRSLGVPEESIEFGVKTDEQFGGRGKYLVWLAQQHAKNPGIANSLDNLRMILDWAKSTSADLRQYDFKKALEAGTQWHKDIAEKSTKERGVFAPGRNNYQAGPGETVLYTFPDGWVITSLEELKVLRWEGKQMGHCLDGRGSDYYQSCIKPGGAVLSLRDPSGKPHVTMELTPEGKLVQMQGQYRKDLDTWDPSEPHSKRLLQWVQEHASQNPIPTKFNPQGVTLKPSATLLKTVLPKEQLHQMIRDFYTKKK